MRIQKATILAAISFPLPLVAQPSDGSLVGTIDGDPLRYECSAPNAAGKIECKFVQVLLSNKEKPEDLDAQLAQIPDMLTSENGEIDELCKAGSGAMRDSLARFSRGEALEDGTPPPSDPREREELGKFVGAMEAVCAQRSPEALEALVRLSHDRATQTCTAFINQYSNTFVKVSETLWVAESSPSGACGIVQTSRFSLPENGLGLLWEYTSQKVITNKAGTSEAGVACSLFEETPVLYTWNSGPQRIDCVYID